MNWNQIKTVVVQDIMVKTQMDTQDELNGTRTSLEAVRWQLTGKDIRIGPPKISHFAMLEWQKRC